MVAGSGAKDSPLSTFHFGIDLCRRALGGGQRMIAAGIERQATDSPLLLSEMEAASTEILSQKSMER